MVRRALGESFQRTRSCECQNCTVYCTGKSFERRICGYKNVCELGNEENCLNLSPKLEEPTPDPVSPDPITPDHMYSCWTKHLDKKITKDYDVTFENGTEVPNVKGLSFFEAKRRCDILGPRISNKKILPST